MNIPLSTYPCRCYEHIMNPFDLTHEVHFPGCKYFLHQCFCHSRWNEKRCGPYDGSHLPGCFNYVPKETP